MAEPYVGEIRLTGFNFAPVDWAFCDGSLLPIADYETLFTLIGTTYGGDGQTTFALPDLRGRFPVHQGQGNGLSPYTIGQLGGVQTVTLGSNQIPSHTHSVNCNATANPTTNQTSPSGGVPAAVHKNQFGIYTQTAPDAQLAAGIIGNAGAVQPLPFSIVQPYFCVNFIISLFGVFPSQG